MKWMNQKSVVEKDGFFSPNVISTNGRNLCRAPAPRLLTPLKRTKV